jgi:hypothetical protein
VQEDNSNIHALGNNYKTFVILPKISIGNCLKQIKFNAFNGNKGKCVMSNESKCLLKPQN